MPASLPCAVRRGGKINETGLTPDGCEFVSCRTVRSGSARPESGWLSGEVVRTADGLSCVSSRGSSVSQLPLSWHLQSILSLRREKHPPRIAMPMHALLHTSSRSSWLSDSSRACRLSINEAILRLKTVFISEKLLPLSTVKKCQELPSALSDPPAA